MKVRVKAPIMEARLFRGDITIIDKESDRWVVTDDEDLEVAKWCGGTIDSSDLTEEPGKASLLFEGDMAWAGWYIVKYREGQFCAFSPDRFRRLYDVMEE